MSHSRAPRQTASLAFNAILNCRIIGKDRRKVANLPHSFSPGGAHLAMELPRRAAWALFAMLGVTPIGASSQEIRFSMRLVRHLHANSVLATGLAYPVVPRGDEEVRFQISAEHTPADIDYALSVLAAFEES